MKLIFIFITVLFISSCNFLGETNQDKDFVGSIPSDSLILWLDASQEKTLHEESNGIDISSWDDLSQNEYILAPSGVEAQSNTMEVNGLNVLNFHMTSNFYSITPTTTATSNYSMIAIIEASTVLAPYTILNVTVDPLILGIDTSIPSLTVTASGTFSSTFVGDPNRPMVVTFILNDPDVHLYIDGNHLSTNTGFFALSSITANIEIGSGDLGSIGELLFYNRALSSSEREFLENYLMQKWGI